MKLCFIKIFCRIVEDDIDEELCWMETPLTESAIIIPPKEESETATTAENDENTASREENSENENLTKFLPPNTFAQISPRCFLFPGTIKEIC